MKTKVVTLNIIYLGFFLRIYDRNKYDFKPKNEYSEKVPGMISHKNVASCQLGTRGANIRLSERV